MNSEHFLLLEPLSPNPGAVQKSEAALMLFPVLVLTNDESALPALCFPAMVLRVAAAACNGGGNVSPDPDDYVVAIVHSREGICFYPYMPVRTADSWVFLRVTIHRVEFKPYHEYERWVLTISTSVALTLQATEAHNSRLVERLRRIEWGPNFMIPLENHSGLFEGEHSREFCSLLQD